MKRFYFQITLALIIFSSISVNAQMAYNMLDPQPLSETILNSRNEDCDESERNEILEKWIEVKNEIGIKVYFSEYEQFDGVSGLKIKFENQTTEKISFSWSLTNNAKTMIRENVLEVEANKSIEILDDKNPISFDIGESMSDFNINLYIRKQ